MHLTGKTIVRCVLLATLSFGCDDDEVDSNAEARQAYTGLDGLVETAIDLGFKGMNAGNGATIPAQMSMGAKTGTVTVSGQVDQGSSSNKNMRLHLALAAFANGGDVTYDSPAGGRPAPTLDLSLKKLPDGTLDGTLSGDFAMRGGLSGIVTLAITITGEMEPDPADATKVRRKPGTTKITGTARSDEGTYDVDVTR